MTDAIQKGYDDRTAGCVVGSAIGDALGYPVEFQSDVSNAAPMVHIDSVPARYSDDTQMSVAVIRGLLTSRQRGYSQTLTGEEVALEFIKWRDHPEEGSHRAPGGACMSGISKLAGMTPERLRTEMFLTGHTDAGGCGSVMRSYPYGLFFGDLGEAEETAVLHSGMTHRHPGAFAASAAMAAGTTLLVQAHIPPLAVAGVMAATARKYDRTTGEMILEAIRVAQTAGNDAVDQMLAAWRGWNAWEAIASSVLCWLVADRRDPDALFQTAVLLAVNSPGDSDSLGAITGALAGAQVGLSGIPRHWVERVECRDKLLGLAARISALDDVATPGEGPLPDDVEPEEPDFGVG